MVKPNAPVALCLLEDVTPALLDLRHRLLRKGQPPESASYPDVDPLPTTKHLGAFAAERLVGCATMQADPSSTGNPTCRLRIRGMAVDPAWQGQGIGTRMVQQLQQWARKENSGIWCNARILAVPMYARCGFEITSEEFDMPLIGPHYNMEWNDAS